MTNRIDVTLARLRTQGRKALVPYITAGDPHPDVTVELMHALVAGGADILELGIPFSDPMADGPVIQRAAERALKHKVSLRRVFEMVRTFRATDQTTPIVLMGYANPVERLGYTAYSTLAAEVGVDGSLVVDLPPEESDALVAALEVNAIYPIFLLAPTTEVSRLAEFSKRAKGYVYYVSLKGITGAAHLDTDEVATRVNALRTHINLPIGVGFGIRDGVTAAAIGKVADAVIVGTRIVQEIENSTVEMAASKLTALIRELREAMDAEIKTGVGV